MERAIILGAVSSMIEVEDLPENFRSIRDGARDFEDQGDSMLNLDTAVDIFTKRHIERVLEAVHNDKKQAAKLLGLGLSSLYRKMDELHISRRLSDQVR